MIDQARARLGQTIAQAQQAAREEVAATFRALSNVYETVIFNDGVGLSVQALPTRHLGDVAEELTEYGLRVLQEDAEVLDVQVAVAALLSSAGSSFDDAMERLTTPASIERALDESALTVLNRLLYLPTVTAEHSPPSLGSLLDHVAAAKREGVPVVVFAGTLTITGGNVALALLAGGSVILLQLVQDVASGMTPGLGGLGRRLTERWEHPEEDA